jgi:heme-degrading monooxygenase HmoA
LIVRISRGRFDPARAARITELLREGEGALRPALAAMPGLIDYYVAIESDAGVMVNVSVWDTLDHAQAMSTLPEMLAQRDTFLAEDVQFEPILNHEVLWSIDVDCSDCSTTGAE